MSATAAIRTQLTSVIDTLTTPVVLGPMANVAGGSLAGRVSKAGGLGFIGAGTFDAAKLQAEIETAHQILGIDKPLRGTGNRVHLGIGFLVWRLSNLNKGPPPSLGASDLDASSPALHLIDAALRSKPRAIWLSFGDEADMVGWSSIVRDREAALNGAGKAAWGKELKLFVGVGNEAQAKAAVEDCGADVVVVQGESSRVESALVDFPADRGNSSRQRGGRPRSRCVAAALGCAFADRVTYGRLETIESLWDHTAGPGRRRAHERRPPRLGTGSGRGRGRVWHALPPDARGGVQRCAEAGAARRRWRLDAALHGL